MNDCDTKAASEASQAVWERKRARIKGDMQMSEPTEALRGEFREIDLDKRTGRVKVGGENKCVYFADTPELRSIVPSLLGCGEVTFYVQLPTFIWYHIVAIEPDSNQAGASE
jgi:hypothetical protein